MSDIVGFLQSPDGQNSSKRLVGIISGILFCLLAFFGGMYFLLHNEAEHFQNLLETVGYFSGTLLGFGVADIFFKKKYDKTANTDGA